LADIRVRTSIVAVEVLDPVADGTPLAGDPGGVHGAASPCFSIFGKYMFFDNNMY